MKVKPTHFPRSTRGAQAGFTLAEVMIAVTVLAFIGLLTYGVFGNTLETRRRAMKVATRYHEVKQGMNRMAREISMAFLSHHRDCDDRRTYTIFKKDSSGGSDSLVFTSFSHIKIRKDANESDQNELSYFVEPDKENNGIHTLYRREANRIDDEPEKGGEVYALIEDVDNLKFEFYNDKDDDWEDDWDTENSDFRNRLPLFVKITLKAKGPSGKIETFVTKTEIFMRKTGAPDDALHIFGTGFTKCID